LQLTFEELPMLDKQQTEGACETAGKGWTSASDQIQDLEGDR